MKGHSRPPPREGQASVVRVGGLRFWAGCRVTGVSGVPEEPSFLALSPSPQGAGRARLRPCTPPVQGPCVWNKPGPGAPSGLAPVSSSAPPDPGASLPDKGPRQARPRDFKSMHFWGIHRKQLRNPRPQ